MKLEEKCEVQGTDNIQGQNNMRSYVHLQMEAVVFIILIVLSLNSSFNIFLNTSDCGLTIGYSPDLAGRIQSLRFHDELLWTVGLTIEIELRFQFPAA